MPTFQVHSTLPPQPISQTLLLIFWGWDQWNGGAELRSELEVWTVYFCIHIYLSVWGGWGNQLLV